MIIEILLLSILVLLIFVTISILTIIKKLAKNYMLVVKHTEHIVMLNTFLETTYEVVYKEQIVSFSVSGHKPDNETFETIRRNFIKLSLQMMGTLIVNELISFYGSHETLIKNIDIFFRMKSDNDELLELMQDVSSNNEEA